MFFQTMCVAMEFTNSMTNIIHSCLEEDTPTSDFLSGTLDFIVSMISTRKYPKAVTVHMIMVKLLQVDTNCIHRRCLANCWTQRGVCVCAIQFCYCSQSGGNPLGEDTILYLSSEFTIVLP